MIRGVNKKIVLLVVSFLTPILGNAATQVGFVNVTEVFNSSSFVKEANKKLQVDISHMNAQLEQQRNKLRQLIAQYHAAKSKLAKKNLESPLKTEEMVLKNLTDSFQQKIHQDELLGKQQFEALLRKATARAAKARHINAIIKEESLLYNDDSWINLTLDVERALQLVTEEDARR